MPPFGELVSPPRMRDAGAGLHGRSEPAVPCVTEGAIDEIKLGAAGHSMTLCTEKYLGGPSGLVHPVT